MLLFAVCALYTRVFNHTFSDWHSSVHKPTKDHSATFGLRRLASAPYIDVKLAEADSRLSPAAAYLQVQASNVYAYRCTGTAVGEKINFAKS